MIYTELASFLATGFTSPGRYVMDTYGRSGRWESIYIGPMTSSHELFRFLRWCLEQEPERDRLQVDHYKIRRADDD